MRRKEIEKVVDGQEVEKKLKRKWKGGGKETDFPRKKFQSTVMMKKVKTTENYRNWYVAEKCIIYKLSKISIPNVNSIN